MEKMYRQRIIKMKIEEIIKAKLIIIPKSKIVNKLGYASNKKALEALDKFTSSKDLYNWLHSGYYDFKYTALSFFKKLCEIIDIDKDRVEQALLDDKKYHVQLKRFQDSYIYVNTNFKRKGEPIFALAFLESRRRLKMPVENLLFKTEDEILNCASDFIAKHFTTTKGDIGIWGKAVNYVFHYNGKRYNFDTEGNHIYNIDVPETMATLHLK